MVCELCRDKRQLLHVFPRKKYRKNCRISKGNIVKGDDDAATVFCYFLWFFFQLTIKTKVKKKWNSKQTKNLKNEQFEEEQEKKIYKKLVIMI